MTKHLPLCVAVVALGLMGCGNTAEIPGAPNTDSGTDAPDAAGPAGGDAATAGVDAGADGGTGADTGSAGGSDAGATDGGNRAPSCSITAPVTGGTVDYDANVTFVASASDPEDGALSGASVVWRSSLLTAPLGAGLTVTSKLAPGAHTITCTATDSKGLTGTGTVTISSRSPIASLNHPSNGETRSAATNIPFSGTGRDFEDGALTGASLVWTSSLDGQIGTGLSFNARLSAGTNVVTLTVKDSNGNTGAQSITLTITP